MCAGADRGWNVQLELISASISFEYWMRLATRWTMCCYVCAGQIIVENYSSFCYLLLAFVNKGSLGRSNTIISVMVKYSNRFFYLNNVFVWSFFTWLLCLGKFYGSLILWQGCISDSETTQVKQILFPGTYHTCKCLHMHVWYAPLSVKNRNSVRTRCLSHNTCYLCWRNPFIHFIYTKSKGGAVIAFKA